MFLPQLLQYPNPSDPLNLEAADLLKSSEEEYKLKVKKLVLEFASSKDFKKEKTIHRNSKSTREEMILEDSQSFSDVSELTETSEIFLEEEILN